MCVSIKAPAPPPPMVQKPTTVASATTKQKSPREAIGRDVKYGASHTRRRVGRGTLRIPLTSSGLSRTGLNLPTA